MEDKFIINCTTVQESTEVARYYGYSGIRDSIKSLRVHGRKVMGHDSLEYYLQNHSDYHIISFRDWKESLEPKAVKPSEMKYVVEAKNQLEAKKILEVMGNRYDLNPREYTYPHGFSSNGQQSPIMFYQTMTKEYGPVLSFKDWSAMFGVELKPTKTLKLTKEYNAVVNYTDEIVQVGCQSIPFATVEELYKLIKE